MMKSSVRAYCPRQLKRAVMLAMNQKPRLMEPVIFSRMDWLVIWLKLFHRSIMWFTQISSSTESISFRCFRQLRGNEPYFIWPLKYASHDALGWGIFEISSMILSSLALFLLLRSMTFLRLGRAIILMQAPISQGYSPKALTIQLKSFSIKRQYDSCYWLSQSNCFIKATDYMISRRMRSSLLSRMSLYSSFTVVQDSLQYLSARQHLDSMSSIYAQTSYPTNFYTFTSSFPLKRNLVLSIKRLFMQWILPSKKQSFQRYQHSPPKRACWLPMEDVAYFKASLQWPSSYEQYSASVRQS